MYLDNVVVSGIVILVLTCIFMVAVSWFAWRHISRDVPAAPSALGDDKGSF